MSIPLGTLRPLRAVAKSISGPVLAGYPDRYSVFPNETLRLHVALSSDAPSRSVRVRFYRISTSIYAELLTLNGQTELTYSEQNTATGPRINTTPQHSAEDWDWPVSVELQVPELWGPGLYLAELDVVGVANLRHSVLFVVKRPLSTPTPRILYKLNLATAHAYGASTGGTRNSLYENLTPGLHNPQNPDPPGAKVTLRRPLDEAAIGWIFGRHDWLMISWLYQNGYDFDFCTDVDVHQDANLSLLSRYSLLLSIGHDEYWSDGMRQSVEAFIGNGGNVAFLSGNTCCWRIHFTNTDPVLGVPTAFVCDKGTGVSIRDATGADAWWLTDNRSWPENTMTGVGTRNGGIRGPGAQDDPFAPASDSAPELLSAALMPGFTVQHADHWAYTARHATGLVDGSIFGQAGEGSLVGYECDGAAFEQDPSNPAYVRPTGADGTPRNFVIIGKAELTPNIYAGVGYGDGVDEPFHKRWGVLPRENTLYVSDASGTPRPRLEGPYMATMGSYSRYGTVLTAATTDWVRGLCAHKLQSEALRERTEPGRPVIWGRDPVDKITRNVLDTLSHRRLNAVGMGDLDGDGKDDLLLQNQTTGDLVYWRMDGTTRLSRGSILYDGFYPPGSYLPSGSDINVPRWKVVGVADFNGDGKPDVLFQNALSGELSYWLLDGTERTRTATITYDGSYPPGTAWKVVGVADLNADGQPDILFQNQLTGELSVWYLEGGHRIATSAIHYDGTSAPGVEWKAVGLADFNGDLRPEILFQSQVTGDLSCWVLSGDTRTGILPITHDGTYAPGVDWKVVALGSWNEDGQTTILFQNRNNGLLSYWRMNGSQRLLSGAPTPASPWTT